MKKAGKEILKLLLTILIIGVLLVGGMYLIDHFSTKESHADSATADKNFYTYTFTYYNEYYLEGVNEYHGSEVISLCVNDIVDKQNNGYATATYTQDSDTQGAWTEDYNCFSTKYYIEKKTTQIKLLPGEVPDLSKIRDDFDVFYSNFLYWQTNTGKVYSEFGVPGASEDVTFVAQYKIGEKLHFTVNNDAEFEATLNLNTADISLREKILNTTSGDKTVYYYGYDFRNAPVSTIYQYFVFKGAYLNSDGIYKIGVCNIRDESKLLTVEYTGFTNQNKFNDFRSGYTGKTYYATPGNSLCDLTYSLFGKTGVVSNVCSAVSSTAQIAEDATGAVSGGLFIFSDFLSNAKLALTYILAIGIVVLIVFFILKGIFYLIRLIGGIANGKKKKFR